MNLLHVVHGFAPEFTGGTEGYVARLLPGLRSSGHQVTLVAGTAARSDATTVDVSDFEGIKVHRIRRDHRFLDQWFASRSAGVEHRFLSLLHRLRPDIVHIHHWKRLSRGLVRASVYRGCRVVVTLHDTWSTCLRGDRLVDGELCLEPPASCHHCAGGLPHQPGRETRLEGLVFHRDLRQEISAAHAVLVPTRALAGFVLPFLGLPARRATKLALPPLEDRVGTSGARAPFDGTRPLGVAYWGHLDPGKGAHLLVDAASRLVQGGKSIRLDLHGDSVTPGYRQSLERAASDAGVDARFHGAFRITELVTDHVDVAVFPSLYHESHSFVLDEARSRGLPVVVPDRGAYPERLAEGGGGVLFRPGEAGDLARCLERFIENPLELEALRQEVKPSSPTWPEHLEALDAVYSEVMSAELEEAAWCPPRSGERLDERALAHRESLVEVLEDRVKVIPVLEREIEAHKEVGQKLQMEIAEHRESSSCLRADLDSHKKVLATKEKDLSGHRDTLREREADLHRHRAVLKERTRRVEDLEGELARAGEEIARLSDETRRVVAELEQIRGALERESEDARQKGLVVDTLERDLAGHRAVLEHLAEGLVKSTGLAEEVARVEAFPVDASGETPGEQAVRSLQQLDTLLRGIRDRSLRHRLRRLWSGRERR